MPSWVHYRSAIPTGYKWGMPHPLPLPMLTAAQVADFWRHVDRSGGPEACWPWTGDHVACGYGRYKIRGRELKPHRLALALTLGHDPGGAITRHTCDNPPCCNPAHLLPGTHADNAEDRRRRGRGRAGAGERHGTKTHPESHAKGSASVLAKLTEADVEEARRLYLAGGVTQAALAARYGVLRETMGVALRGKNWAHVPGDAAAIRRAARAMRNQTGEHNPSAKLTASQVRAIRTSDAPAKVLAAGHGVTKELIYAIRRGRVWKHLV